MRGSGGADAAKHIGTGGGYAVHAQAVSSLQHLVRQGVRRATQADRVLSTRCHSSHLWPTRQDECQRAGPKRVDEFLRKRRHMAGKPCNTLGASHMHDERMIRGATFGCKNFGHRSIVARIGG